MAQAAQEHLSLSCSPFPSSAMPTGTCKKFFGDKGWGFITPDDGGDDVFVHRKVNTAGDDRTAYLEPGDAVTYEVEWDDREGKYNASSCSPFRTGGNFDSGKGGGGSWGGKGGGDSWGGDSWGGKGW